MPVTATGDDRLLRIVVENLLNNAWKFTSKQDRATIEMGCTTESGERVYFVRDDGAGFDMAFAEKLFGAFQRLQAALPATVMSPAPHKKKLARHCPPLVGQRCTVPESGGESGRSPVRVRSLRRV